MEVRMNIYGKDYSPVCFEEYKAGRNEGVKLDGIEYDDKLVRLVITNFLKSENDKIQKNEYRVGKNDKRTKTNSLLLYLEDKERIYYQNIVGVLSVKDYKLSDEIIQRHIPELSEKKRREYAECVYHINLQISSRFDGKYTYFLPTMFKSGNLKVNEYQIPRNEDDMFDFLLVFEFVRNLKNAYTCGIYRRYQRFQKNDSHVRGSIQIARHIRLNAGMENGNIAYSYRENTADNVMNHLILYTYAFIQKRFPDLQERLIEENDECRKILNEIKSCAKNFGQFSVRKIMEQCSRQIAQPYYYGYEKLRQTCLMILKHIGISIFDGSNDDTTEGILFYMPDLWEDFLENVMREKIKKCELRAQKEVRVYKERNQYIHKTYPDFIFYRNNCPVFVLDAKFKKKWENEFDLNDYTKCIRDMNSLNVHATGVIYPVQGEANWSEEDVKHPVSEYNQKDCFYKFPIYVPDSTEIGNYEEWFDAFDESIVKTMQELQLYVEKEKKRI